MIAPGPEITKEIAVPPANAGGGSSILHVGGPALPYDPTYHLLWRLGRVRKLVGRIRPDVLEIHSPYLAAAGAMAVPAAHFGIRTFVWHADFIDTYLRGGLERSVMGLPGRPKATTAARAVDAAVEPLWAWVRTIAASCSATFAASRFQADKLKAHGVVRVELVPFGVEKAIFRPDQRDESLRRERLGERHGPLVVAIGRFAVEKRWDVIMEAFDRIALAKPGAKLLVFGDGPERARIETWAKARGDVELVGFLRGRAPLARLLASSDLLLHACPFETFGLGVAEAIASGLPAVVPDRGGAAELARGESVVTYPSLDAAAAAASALALLERPSNALRSAAADTAAKVHSMEDHFKALFERYEALLTAAKTAI